MVHHFGIGARVRLVEPHSDLSTGQLGTVMQTYPMPGVYAVQFDGQVDLHVVPAGVLAGVPGQYQNVQSTITFASE